MQTTTETSVDNLLEQQAAIGLDQERQEAEQRQEAMRIYVRLLQRANSPDPADALSLREIMADYGISPDQVRRDAEIVKSVAECHALIADRAAAAKEWHEACAAYERAKKALEEKLHQARLGKARAQGRQSASLEAGRDLARLSQERPDLFAIGQPPRLLIDE